MCTTCGCGIPTDVHGDRRNITVQDLKAAAEVQGITLLDALKNFIKTLPVIIKNYKTYE